MNLRELLKDWEDQDVCAYYLACCLGLAEYEDTFAEFREAKYIYSTGNKTSDLLYKILRQMSEIHMLEFDDEAGKYRWNQSFKT